MLKIWLKNSYIVIGIETEMKLFKGSRNQVYEWHEDVSG